MARTIIQLSIAFQHNFSSSSRRLLLLISLFPVLSIFIFNFSAGQTRDYRIHSRGLLHETVYNTGEIGRAYDNGTGGIISGLPSMEWPPYSRQVIDRVLYAGQHNSFGGGIWIAGRKDTVRNYAFCGAVTDNNGNTTPVEGMYSYPVTLSRQENYPVLADGSLNPSYTPDSAEESITARWGTPVGFTVTRTSRAWSYPGYDSFIIYEYELDNTSDDTLFDVFVAFPYGFCTSMFGYERTYYRWAESDTRVRDQFARFDFRRYLTYNHDRQGKPDSDTSLGLDSPQAAGLLMLHYDYDHLAVKGQTQLSVTGQDTMAWDENQKIKQPFLNRYESANLYPSKIQLWLDPLQIRKTRPFRLSDSQFLTSLYGQDSSVWMNGHWEGRARPSVELGNSQPATHGYGFGPYLVPPHQKINFSVAEVVGYGPGIATDTIYKDLGGGMRGIDAGPYLHPVPSWHDTIYYPALSTIGSMGSTYLQTHRLPWYVSTGVVSIRDVADRAIQFYTGGQLVKYDTSQFDPRYTRVTGTYQPIQIPFPAPNINIVTRFDTTGIRIFNDITWSSQIEMFSSPRLIGMLNHYDVYKSEQPSVRWTKLDSVAVHDPRYFKVGSYSFHDTSVQSGGNEYYAILSIDTYGNRSGYTNITLHYNDVARFNFSAVSGWNMISIPLTVAESVGTGLFPHVTTPAYYYQDGYKIAETLTTGKGYWLRFSSPQSVVFEGATIFSRTIPVFKGWNMIGSISTPLPIASITSIPGGIVTGVFYGFNGSYFATDTIEPGMAYWVKVADAGSLILNATSFSIDVNRIRIIPTNEPPPPPPEGVSGKPRQPKVCALEQAYPNPFNPATTIRYQISTNSKVSLKVYNLLGQIIQTLADDTQEAGYKQVIWNASNFTSGMYFYRLDVVSSTDPNKTFTSMRKVLLIR